MLTGSTPDAGNLAVGKGQAFRQRNYVVATSSFAPGVGPRTPPSPTFPEQGIFVRGLPSIRLQVYHYGVYNDGIANWVPRPWISWRVVGYIPPGSVTTQTSAIDTYVPLSSPQLTSINNPVSIQIRPGGAYYVGIEFDTTGGTPVANQGYDRILVSISASG
jgi:hypothetical protein